MTPTDAPAARRHDLDALRAFAMLLGIGLHAGLSFALMIPWVVQDSHQNILFTIGFAAIHGFRMPLFFLLSGFFTAMLWRRRGLRATLWHRTRRILLPCLIGLVTIVPLVNLSAEWVMRHQPAATVAEEMEIGSLVEAVRYGDAAVTREWLAGGADPNERDPQLQVPALGWAALLGKAEAAAALLDAGADVNGRNVDGATALHGAAYFGHDEVVAVLVARGADVNAVSDRGERPWQSSRGDWSIAPFIAGFLKIPLPDEEPVAGRERVRELLAAAGGGAEAQATPEPSEPEGPLLALRSRYFEAMNSEALSIPAFWTGAQGERLHLVNGAVFHHLWFLWFLCWLTPMFALYAWCADRAGWQGPPRWLVLSSARWLWVLPLTMAVQWFMHVQEPGGFGPDTSIGVIPMPHVLAYYAVFYFFGALYYDCDDAEGRLGRLWWLALPASVVLLLAGIDPNGASGWEEFFQVLYVWAMSVGLIGLCRKVLSRRNDTIRYVSDSSYWLYLAHLPLVFVAQALVRDWDEPSFVKFTLICIVITALLLLSYQTMVRYTWIGRLLNGPRTRPPKAQPIPGPAAEPAV